MNLPDSQEVTKLKGSYLKVTNIENEKIRFKRKFEKYSCIEACPVRNIISRFSGKWSILVLCVLSENEATRFNAIRRAIPDISPKVLAATLKNLEDDKLIKRELFPEIPPRVEYSLTDKGRSLMPHLNSLIEWSLKNWNI